ncbi:MAG: sugar phosphate nucleotidyltransferase [Bacillota bacterium]
MKAVIMAGGQGTRLRPLTCDLPKPMVPVLNIPVMEHIINLLKKHKITEIAVTTYYLPEKITEYFGSGEKWGVELRYYNEEKPLGTAGSVHNAAEFLDETFLVISGDALTDYNLQQGIDFHQEKNARGTILLSQEDVPLEYGVVMVDQEGQIFRFLEKPNWGQVFSDTVNTGIYILEPDIFSLYEQNIKFDFSQDLFPLMLKNDWGLFGVNVEGYWNDIGNIEEYRATNFALLQGKLNLPLPQYRQIGEKIWAGENVELSESAELVGPLLIGEESFIGQDVYLERCILGRNNCIKDNSSLKHSILWDNCYVGHKCQFRETVLTNNVQCKNNVDIFDHTGIGRKTVLESNVKIKPGVKIWPEKEIEKGAVVEDSIIWSPRWSRNLFSGLGIRGLSNIDINPEFAAKLAAAFGATLKKHSEVVVSCDNYEISNSLKRAVISGLQSSGIKVIDIGYTITPVVRYSVHVLEAEGGINLRVCSEDPEKVTIEFLNEYGANVDTRKQKAIEKKYFAENYRRVNLENIGGYSYAAEMNRSYLEEIISNLAQEKIKRNRFNLVLDYEYDNLLELLPVFLKNLNCQIISTRNFSFNGLPLALEKRLQAKNKMGRIIRENNYDFGIIVDHNGEQLNLVDSQGEVLSEPEFKVLISYILLEKGIDVLHLPVNSPRVIEKLAANYDTEINYTPVRPQYVMNRYLQQKGTRYNFYPFRDVIFSLGLILEKMARENITYRQLVNQLPEFYLKEEQVYCKREDKGRVMRSLSDQAGPQTELIDGIKFNHKQGWALVIPDSEAASFHVFAEAQDAETAQSLTGLYQEKLNKLIGQGNSQDIDKDQN